MAKVTAKLDSEGVRALLKSPEIADFCEQNAARMTRATGVEYTADVHYGRSRVNAGGYQRKEDA